MSLGIRSRLTFDVNDCVHTLFSPPGRGQNLFNTIVEENRESFNVTDTSFDVDVGQEWSSELLTPTSSDSSLSFLESPPSPRRFPSNQQSSRRSPTSSPPSLRGLRLFDTPHTPKTLLERSKNHDHQPPSSPDLRQSRSRRFGLRTRRHLGERKNFSEPRNLGSHGRIETNINPFTPNHNESSIQKHKRCRMNINE